MGEGLGSENQILQLGNGKGCKMLEPLRQEIDFCLCQVGEIYSAEVIFQTSLPSPNTLSLNPSKPDPASIAYGNKLIHLLDQCINFVLTIA